jgi:hypothetical protein
MFIDTEGKSLEGILCYIGYDSAYFTTQSLDDQWGDDWNDAPYEHNAGTPYKYRADRMGDKDQVPWKITKIFFEGNFDTPNEGVLNSRYSVEQINNKVVPWLRGSRFTNLEGKVTIWAGTPLDEFCRTILECGGQIYLPIELANLFQVTV